MNYIELAQKIVDKLEEAQKEGRVYQYTMYYWLQETETTEELARILEEILEEVSREN